MITRNIAVAETEKLKELVQLITSIDVVTVLAQESTDKELYLPDVDREDNPFVAEVGVFEDGDIQIIFRGTPMFAAGLNNLCDSLREVNILEGFTTRNGLLKEIGSISNNTSAPQVFDLGRNMELEQHEGFSGDFHVNIFASKSLEVVSQGLNTALETIKNNLKNANVDSTTRASKDAIIESGVNLTNNYFRSENRP